MRGLVVGVVLLGSAWIGAAAAQAPEGTAGPKGHGYALNAYAEPEKSSLSDTEYMKVGVGAAPWLPRIAKALAANRPGWELLDAVLVNSAEDQRYLVTIWRWEWGGSDVADFHRVFGGTKGRPLLKFVRRIEEVHVEFTVPTGRPLAKGEPPVVVLFLASLGSGAFGYSRRIIQMTGNTKDVTPGWAGRVVDVVDLDEDSSFEVVTVMPEWPGYFDGRGAAGPHVPVVVTRRHFAFVPACKAHHTVFETASLEDAAYDQAQTWICWWAEGITTDMLTAAQVGDFAKARQFLSLYESTMTSHLDACPPPPDRIIQDLRDAIEAAERAGEYPCPLSAGLANDGGGHYGTEAVIRHFTWQGR